MAQQKTVSLPMVVLAGHHRQGDQYETLNERSGVLSSSAGLGLEFDSEGPPFAPDAHGRRRDWTAKALTYVSLLMAWIEGVSLLDRFRSARAALRQMFPSWSAVGKTYQGFVKALLVEGVRLADALAGRLREQMLILNACWRVRGVLAFAADGSRVECPRTAANQKALRCAGKKKTGPQLSLTTIYHMGSGCPWDCRIGPGTDSERTHLRQMIPLLPPGATIVADAGFIGYDLLREILSSGRHVIFRAGANVRLLRKLGYVEVEDDSTVYLWPDKAQKANQPPLVLRRIAWQGFRHPLTVVTDMPEQDLSVEQAAVLYRLRWGVEVFYRGLKQTLSRRKMRSGAPAQARMELMWALMGLWILSLRSVQAVVAAGKTPHSLSLAMALRQVRQALAGQLRRGCSLEKRLAGALKDSYVRTRSKTARAWPHKKNDKPPGNPKLLEATEKQRQQAARLRTQAAAA